MLCDPVDQFVGQFRHVHQLRPGPLQAGAELGEEMPHAGFAAGKAIGFENAHLGKAQAEAVSDHVVDVLRRGDAVMDEP